MPPRVRPSDCHGCIRRENSVAKKGERDARIAEWQCCVEVYLIIRVVPMC